MRPTTVISPEKRSTISSRRCEASTIDLRDQPTTGGTPMYEPIILRNVGVPDSWDVDVALAHGDYQALPKALGELQPDQIIDMVKNSGLRGRGGAGAPCGMKWGFVPKGKREKYLLVNGDESEPGTFSNRAILENDPHQLVEGIVISAFALQAPTTLVYIRGEFALGHRRFTNAVK